MLGRMMEYPLTITHLLERGRTYFSGREVVSVRPDKSLTRTTYADLATRSARLANALAKLGVKTGDRVATFSWNHHQHLECYYGIPAMGAIVHTLNLRLNPSEVGYIANHAQDVAIVVDQSLWPLFEKFRGAVSSLRHVIVIRDKGEPLPEGTLDYEALLTDASPDITWPKLDENAAAMLCYTSGTTGNPKGVLYSHRSTVLHALTVSMPDVIGFCNSDVVLPVVPMFHAAGWGLPYAAVLTGAKIVMPGPHLDPQSLVSLMEKERVTVAGGVPTIWLGILQLLDANPGKFDLSSVRTMAIGGSAAPPSLMEGFKTRHNLEVTHAWGMTETNPVGTVARVKSHLRGDYASEMPFRATQGMALPFVDTRHVDDSGKVLPWDGVAVGELEVRGPWVAGIYFNEEGADRFTKDGWFKTGDVVKIDAEGYISITDRSKDVIKSGGEWISSVALENALMAHPAIAEAAVFAARHPKWTERPVAAIVFKPGQTATDDQLRAHLAKSFNSMNLPDAFIPVDQVPRNSTGKFMKSKLREQYGEILIQQKP
jgi:fatty-acyl-CoA synthase